MKRLGWLLLGLVGMALLAPAGLVATAKPARAAADGALVGLWPDQNLSTIDTLDQSTVAAFTPGQYTQPSQISYITAMNAWQGKSNSIIQFYDSVDPNAFSSWAPVIWDDYHAIPMMTLNTGGTDGGNGCCTNAEVAAGADDSNLIAFGQALQKWVTQTDVLGAAPPASGLGRRIYLRPDWEANGSWYAWAPPNVAATGDCGALLQAETDYRNMWIRVHDDVMSAGLNSSQVQWVFSVNSADVLPAQLESCANGASDVTKNIFPGDAYVDWTGIDGYSFCSVQTPSQILGSMVTELRSISTRPVSTDENGASTSQTIGTCADPSTKGRWIAGYLGYLQSSSIKMSVWFNANIFENGNPTDWAVFSLQNNPLDIASHGDCTYSSGGIAYNVYCEYAQGLASPYFAGSDPVDDRVVDDAEFQGTWSYTPSGTAPAAPVLTAAAGPNQVSLSWTAPADGGSPITGYEVYRGAAPGTETAYQAADPTATTYVDAAVAPGATYYYEVHAINAIGTGSASNEVGAVPAKGGAIAGLWPDQQVSAAATSDPLGEWAEPSQASYVPAMNTWQGRANSVMDFQTSLDPNAIYTWLPNIWDGYHAVPMFSFPDENGNQTDAQVAAGQVDQPLFAFASNILAWVNGTDDQGSPAPPGGRRLYLRMNYDANVVSGNVWTPGAEGPTTCAALAASEQDFINAWRRVHTIFADVGLKSTQIQWVFAVEAEDQPPAGLTGCAADATTGISHPSEVAASIYPGDAYVDWTGVDGGSPCSGTSPSAYYGPMAAELAGVTTRPLSLDAAGATSTGACGGGGLAAKAQWITSYFSYVQTAGVKLSVWYNVDDSENGAATDWAVFSLQGNPLDPASRGDCTYSAGLAPTYNTYCEYPAGLLSAGMVGASAADPRVIGDAEFEGSWT